MTSLLGVAAGHSSAVKQTGNFKPERIIKRCFLSPVTSTLCVCEEKRSEQEDEEIGV